MTKYIYAIYERDEYEPLEVIEQDTEGTTEAYAAFVDLLKTDMPSCAVVKLLQVVTTP